VAIKLIDNYCKSEYTCVKIVRELQIMKALKDNKQAYLFIPEIVDVICPTAQDKARLLPPQECEKEFIFIVMEYVESDLKSLISISEGSNFSESHLILILYYLLCGLKFLHSSNIIHRDLKPQNILINQESQVKICDFGISRTLPESLLGKGSGNSKRVRD
jgi:mitogen-activated protein kinase 1/3